jgi:hypothetical protein
MTINSPACIYCNLSDQDIPLLSFQYRNEPYWICPEHLPILIHHPDQLADKLSIGDASSTKLGQP